MLRRYGRCSLTLNVSSAAWKCGREGLGCLGRRHQSSASTASNTPLRKKAQEEDSSERSLLQPLRAMSSPVKFRATSLHRHTKTVMEEEKDSRPASLSLHVDAPPSDPIDEKDMIHRHASTRIEDVNLVTDTTGMNEVEIFLEHVDLQTENARHTRNQSIPYPAHPDTLVPEFRRIKRHQKQEVLELSPVEDRPQFTRRDVFVASPPSAPHPWLGKHTPIGDHIVHGDGQIHVVGTGEVGFEDSPSDGATQDRAECEERRGWRGLQHSSVVHRTLPSWNATVHPDVVVKHSFSLSGRGVFATKPIAKGETIMISVCTARSVGVKGELERLEEMCAHIIRKAQEEREMGYLDYLHHWILSGQPSPLLEHWSQTSTKRVLDAVGGLPTLYALELHPIHIARMAAIMDLNSFLLESSYAERKGMAYFPEAGFFNHSCHPNTSYEIMPQHMFEESDYCVDEDAKASAHQEKNAASGNSAVVSSSHGLSVAAQQRAADRLDRLHSGKGDELTEYGAPEYLFCCRAEKNIAAGEEILISYVPPEWSFDNRQYVLHDRYRFYCKCPRCAPTIDSQYARIPRLVVLLVIVSVGLQLLLMRVKRDTSIAHEEGGQRNEESPRRLGLLELLEKEQLEQHNAYPGSERLPSHITDDYSRK